MELIMVKNSSLLGLVEYKLRNEPATYFENDFGMIRNGKIIFHNLDIVLDINEIAFIKLTTAKKRNKIGIMLATLVFPVSLYFIKYNFLPLFFPIVVFAFLFYFLKRKVFFIQIVFCRIEQKVIPIDKKQRAGAKALIESYSHYRNLNKGIL